MRVVVVTVGRPRGPGVAEAVRDYETRAARYWPLAVHEVKEEKARSLPPDVVRARESERLASRIGDAMLVACDVDGDRLTSEQFAHWLQTMRERGRRVAFAIGGALGLAPAMRDGAARRLSLAPWTLPHELARLVLAEQLYRAGTIVRGEPYHK